MPSVITSPDPARLLLKPREAAQRLSVSDRQLWARTKPRGDIPCVRIGGCVRYDPLALAAWIAQQQDGGAA